MENKYHDKDWLYEQYITRGRTIQSICDEFGVKHQSVERYLKRYGIRKFPVKKMPTADELRVLHHEQGYGIRKIVGMYPGVGETTILKIMEENGIDVMTPGELHTKWWSNQENKKMMSEQRLGWWQDDEYRTKTMQHLTDKAAIRDRAIKASATFQNIGVDEWSGFLTPEQTRIRNSDAYAAWRQSVFQRDGYTCQCCGARSHAGSPVTLHAHHLENFAHNEALRFDVDNGITLCFNCHDIRAHGSFHNLYGIHNNTRKQFEEYMKVRVN